MTQDSDQSKSVSLILGSGGARGLAHIGVIRWLEEHNYHIASISGSSMGALIGGVYAAGKLDEFENWFKTLTNTDILGLLDIAWDRSGLIKGDKLFSILKEMIGDPEIDSLPIRFTAVATDIEQEKEVWLQSGPMLEAIRASIALPMIFTPHLRQGRTLIDGGVLNPVPIAPTFRDHTDLKIAVNLGAKPAHIAKELLKTPAKNDGDASWLNSLSELFDDLKARFLSSKEKLETPFDWDVYEISNKAFDSMQNTIARQKLAAYPPDITIDIPRNACGMLEFTQVNQMVALGYQMAEQTLNHTNPTGLSNNE
ncbi:patatin-like phospholipase family protein [Thiomicrorhabdus sp. zzn3]|uniref:patatin-like phospholipase family protein n=1 Tax=Thiomicrorhabdus sp. zzn3 TaxID=3039775 RepID=UPI0024367665|nr:patatin-like phospholipase family protein [Thiomicrorhabdus sp. zzn3]MDG6778616.1 patatin-like phospholipase family protein [Thiomicrorhabdus sp. zzn3]